MSHLSPEELLAASEGREARTEHLASCLACRSEVEALAAVVRDVASVQVPEPSPLFWEHFSARVRDSTSRAANAGQASAADAKTRAGYRRLWRLIVPVAAALLLVFAGARLLTRPASEPAPATTIAEGSRPTLGASAPVLGMQEAPVADESWGAFTAIAAEADPSGEAFDTPAPGVVDEAVRRMTNEEQGELIRLLKDELARRGARSEG